MKRSGLVADGNQKVRSGLSMRRHAKHTAISTTTESFTTTRLGARGSGDVETGLNPGQMGGVLDQTGLRGPRPDWGRS